MDVQNNSWQLVGADTPSYLYMQNVGRSRIAYVFAASQPAANSIALDSDEHFVLGPGTEPETFTNLSARSLNCYARSLGPLVGQLAVDSVT